MRHRILAGFLLLASCTVGMASSTVAVPSVTVSPSSLSFGTVPVGQAQTLLLNVKNGGTVSFKGGATVTAPYTITPATLSFTSLSAMNVTVTLPASAPAGSHNGTVTITIPSAIAGGPAKEIKVAVTANVSTTPASGIDLKVGTISIKTCGVNSQGTQRSCSFNMPLLTTGTTIIPVKTTLFEARGTGPLTQTFNQALAYNPPGVLPFIYVISALPLDIATVTIKVIVDPDGQTAESNEGNNTLTTTLNVQ